MSKWGEKKKRKKEESDEEKDNAEAQDAEVTAKLRGRKNKASGLKA